MQNFLKSKDLHSFRVFLCTIIIVAIYFIATDDTDNLLIKTGSYSGYLWLYYCVVHVAADSFKLK